MMHVKIIHTFIPTVIHYTLSFFYYFNSLRVLTYHSLEKLKAAKVSELKDSLASVNEI